jgi:hypothetical protein
LPDTALQAPGFDFDRLSNTIADRDILLPYQQLLDDLRSNTMAEWAPPGGGAAGALTHAVIHGLDVTSSLGIARTSDDEACRLVLDLLTADGGARFGVDATGHRYRAIDLDWHHGVGDFIDATAADLVLALAGRPRPGINIANSAMNMTMAARYPEAAFMAELVP